jgi:membrane-associated phospholipid phosphatase
MSHLPNEAEGSSPPSPERTRRFGARALMAGVALALVAVPFLLILLLVEDKWAPLLKADTGGRDTLYNYAVTHQGFVRGMQLISDSGSALAWIVVMTGVVAWLLWRRQPRLVLFVIVTTIGSSLLNSVVKSSVHRLRPVLPEPVAHEPGLSFPSGHAQAAMVGYAVLLLVLTPTLSRAWRRSAVAVAVLMVLAIGFSRVALGVHYVSDVLAGLALGAAWVAAMAAAFDVLGADRSRRGTLRSAGSGEVTKSARGPLGR